MTTPPQSPAPAWRVTGQTETTQVSQGGTPVRGVQVFYSTADGHQGSVFVAYSAYNAQNVARLVGQSAAQMDEIGQLTSGAAGS